MMRQIQYNQSNEVGCSDVLSTFVTDCRCRKPSHMSWYKEKGQVMIIQDKFLSFSGRITDISTKSFKCTVSTNKESLFRGLSTIVFEVHPITGVRACAKILYPSAFTKSERHQYHQILCQMLNEAGESGESLGNVVADARTFFVSRGMCETFVNLTTTESEDIQPPPIYGSSNSNNQPFDLLSAAADYFKNHNTVLKEEQMDIFGKSIDNPIPVSFNTFNLYLHLLRTSDGQPFFFHRIGSVKSSGHNIDVIELVSVNDSEWYLLFFNMYHKEMSSKTPAGLYLFPFDQLDDQHKMSYSKAPWFGTPHKYLPDFPHDIPKAIDHFLEKNFKGKDVSHMSIYWKKPIIEILSMYNWERPDDHKRKLKGLKLASQVGLDGGYIYE